MNKLRWIKIVALSGALSVALAALAAHGSEIGLAEKHMANFRTAVLYQFLHTIALLGIINLADSLLRKPWPLYAASSFVLGIVLFSGSIYVRVIADIEVPGLITPLGGMAFTVGWILLFMAAKRSQ